MAMSVLYRKGPYGMEVQYVFEPAFLQGVLSFISSSWEIPRVYVKKLCQAQLY
jgi:hypothetical protein